MKEKKENFIVIDGVRYFLSLPDSSCAHVNVCKKCALQSLCDELLVDHGLCELFPDSDDKIFVKIL